MEQQIQIQRRICEEENCNSLLGYSNTSGLCKEHGKCIIRYDTCPLCRNIKTRKVKLIKNRYCPIEDYEIEQFILNYKEKVYTKFSRFEIMDI